MEKEGSPGMAAVKLNDCIQQLLQFVLQSFINGSLGGLDLGLSNHFCHSLLNHDHDHDHDLQFQSETPSSSSSSGPGVPLYPLYKGLASALHQWITSGSTGSFVSVSEMLLPMTEDDSSKEFKEKWDELVSAKGFELVNLLSSIKFEIHVQEPYFTLLKDGLKTVEGRCAVGNYNQMGSGDMIFVNKCLMLEVQDVRRYASFSKMLEAESLEKVLPGVLTIEEGEQVYRKFYSEEKEQLNGVLAICVSKPASQPYSVLSDIIAGLGYRGIQTLLGLKHTIGTIPDALPPPRSTLLSSFTSPQHPDV